MKNIIAIKNTLKRISIVPVFLLTLAAGIFGQTVLIADSHTSASAVNENFGTNPALTISVNNAAQVKFNVSRTLPANAKSGDVGKATFKFYVGKVANTRKLDLYPLLADWDEKTITANNAPAVGQLALTTPQIGKDAQGNYLLIDITDLVKHWLGDGNGQNALPNYAFVLIPHQIDADTPQLADITFDSNENSQTSHDASLSVQLQNAATGLQTVAADATLIGDGTAANPLGVAPNAITGTYLADGAATSGKIANGAVTSGKIADNAVGTTKLGDNSVSTIKLADGAVNNAKLADNSVTSSKIVVPLSLSSANQNFTLAVSNSGAGAALTAQGAINTSTQYNIGDARVLSSGGVNNLFAGIGAGTVNAGNNNSFFGNSAGLNNPAGKFNSFFGSGAGSANTGGDNNSFFGSSAGLVNTTGFQNSFFGREAGTSNTEGSFNSFFGRSAGLRNTTGSVNFFRSGRRTQ